MNDFCKENNLDGTQGDAKVQRTPSATSTRSWGVKGSSIIDMARVYILFFKDKSIKNGSKVILDTLSDLDKLNYAQYSKYPLCSSKIYITHVYMLFIKDKSI